MNVQFLVHTLLVKNIYVYFSFEIIAVYVDSTELQKSPRNPATPLHLRRSGSLNLDPTNFKGMDSLRTGIGIH